MLVEVIQERKGPHQPKIIRCACGRALSLTSMTNECDCGAFYNGFAQRLAPPSQWGSETGEHFGEHGEYLGRDGGDD